MKIVIFGLLVFFMCIGGTCRKWDCSQTDYTFEAFYKAYPDKDSISIGDTIWLELTTPTLLKNLMNNQIVDYSGAENFGCAISYLELIGGSFSDPGSLPAANSFDNILKIGFISPTDKQDQIRAYLFKEENGMYVFKLGIVPKKKGLFAIAPGNAANVYRKSDNCSKAGFSLTFKDTDQHIYLYEQSRPGYSPSEYERTHAYCFEVY